MQTFFVEIKCKLGKTYPVASALADREIASEIYSTAGNYDPMVKFIYEIGGRYLNRPVERISRGTTPLPVPDVNGSKDAKPLPVT